MRAGLYLCILAGLLVTASVSHAAEIAASGTTLLRYEDRAIGGFGKQRIGVGTQYLGLDLERLGNGNLSFNAYGWGRSDFSGESGPTGDENAELTYAYLRYRFPNQSSEVTAGRFFVYGRGIGSYIDGLSLKSDLGIIGTTRGVAVHLFTGTPVRTGHIRDNRGDFLTGGRVAYRVANLLEAGVASLYETGLAANGPDGAIRDYRNIIVGDVWFAPYRFADLAGHTAYNTVTRGVAEHRYLVSLRPFDRLTATLEYNDSTLLDLFSSSSQRSLFNPNSGDRITSYGGTATYTLFPFIDLKADYRYSLRSGRADSSRVGGGVVLKLADSRVRSGVTWHRTDVGASTVAPEGFRVVSFNEIRGFILYDNAVYSASLDTIVDLYDRSIHGKDLGYELAGSLGYRLMPNIKLSCDLSMADNPQFSNEIKGVARLVFSQSIAEKPRLDYRARHAGETHVPAATLGEKTGTIDKPAATQVAAVSDKPVPVTLPVEKPGSTGEAKSAALPPVVTKTSTGAVSQRIKGEAKPAGKILYRIEAAGILAQADADRVMAHLKSMGCSNVTRKKMETELPMYRLFAAEFTKVADAKRELRKLRKIAAGAFLLRSAGKYQLYAGSFRDRKNAVAEQKRLSAHRLAIDLREGIHIPAVSYLVTADVSDKASGELLLNQLKKRGLDASLTPRGDTSGNGVGTGNDSTDNDPERQQATWLMNELKRRGVDTSTIILDDDTDTDAGLDFNETPLLTAVLAFDTPQNSEGLLSEVLR